MLCVWAASYLCGMAGPLNMNHLSAIKEKPGKTWLYLQALKVSLQNKNRSGRKHVKGEGEYLHSRLNSLAGTHPAVFTAQSMSAHSICFQGAGGGVAAEIGTFLGEGKGSLGSTRKSESHAPQSGCREGGLTLERNQPEDSLLQEYGAGQCTQCTSKFLE